MKKGSRSLMMHVFKIRQSSMLKIGAPEEKEKEKSKHKKINFTFDTMIES